jgi:hypothetical protein
MSQNVLFQPFWPGMLWKGVWGFPRIKNFPRIGGQGVLKKPTSRGADMHNWKESTTVQICVKIFQRGFLSQCLQLAILRPSLIWICQSRRIPETERSVVENRTKSYHFHNDHAPGELTMLPSFPFMATLVPSEREVAFNNRCTGPFLRCYARSTAIQLSRTTGWGFNNLSWCIYWFPPESWTSTDSLWFVFARLRDTAESGWRWDLSFNFRQLL